MMTRLLTVAAALLAVEVAAAQCQPWFPPYPAPYPLTPAVWGAPAPRPLPAVVPAAPRPRPAPSVQEEDETSPPPKAKDGAKPGEDTKEKDTPRIPKTRLPIPGDPLDKAVPDAPKADAPKTDPPKKEIPPGKAFEQFVVPAEGTGEPAAQVKVGFFNHSERPLALDVNGQAVRLPKGEYVTLRLPRTFRWSERGGKGNSVVVPPDAEGIEIVFRR